MADLLANYLIDSVAEMRHFFEFRIRVGLFDHDLAYGA